MVNATLKRKWKAKREGKEKRKGRERKRKRTHKWAGGEKEKMTVPEGTNITSCLAPWQQGADRWRKDRAACVCVRACELRCGSSREKGICPSLCSTRTAACGSCPCLCLRAVLLNAIPGQCLTVSRSTIMHLSCRLLSSYYLSPCLSVLLSVCLRGSCSEHTCTLSIRPPARLSAASTAVLPPPVTHCSPLYVLGVLRPAFAFPLDLIYW